MQSKPHRAEELASFLAEAFECIVLHVDLLRELIDSLDRLEKFGI
jgi:hypothetical protein